jgi:drug/metabolite transporter (DMT)-like permease
MKRSTLIALLVFNALWAGTYAATKDLMAHAPFFLVTSTRYFVAIVPLLTLTAWRTGLRMPWRDVARCAAVGLSAFTMCPLLMYSGVNLGRSSDAAILTAAEPLLVAVGAYFYLREKISRRTGAALLIAFGGAVLLSEFWRETGGVNAIAVALIAAGVFFEAIYSVLGKEVLARHSPLKVVTYALVTASIVNATALTALGWWPRLGGLDTADWLTLVFYLSLLCTAGGYTFWYVALREDLTSKVAITIFVQPALGLLISWWWVNEQPTASQLAGTAVVLFAVGLALTGSPEQAPIESPREITIT